MGNCLVTKLKEVVNNDNLPFFDTIVFDIKYMENATEYNLSFGFVANAPVTVFTSDGGSFKPDGESPYVQSKEYNINIPTIITFQLYNGNYKLYIRGKNSITTILNDSSDRNNYLSVASFDMNQLYWLSNLENIYMNSVEFYGNIDFADWTKIKGIYLTSGNVHSYTEMNILMNDLAKATNLITFLATNTRSTSGMQGSIEDLGYLINLRNFRIRYNSFVTGDLKKLCDALYANGKRSGTITFDLRNTGCTFNGSPAADYDITFSDEGWS